MKNLKFIDLCAGIGGFRAAFEDSTTHCQLTCEIDKFCHTTYSNNFTDLSFEKDITKIDEFSLEDFDILCAGFPCQAFSLGGKKEGFKDIRGTIFFDIVRILNEKRPSSFILENVKNLKRHDKGNTFKVIEQKLDELNYWYADLLVNAKHFVPQKRERIYIVGLSKDIFTKAEFDNLINNIQTKYNIIKQNELPNFKDILETTVHDKYTLSDKLWSFLQSHANKHALKGNGFGFGLMNPQEDMTSRTLTARYYKDGSEILVAQKGKNPRRLTPRECARLMGYDDSFKIVVSDTQAYKQFGNSVVVPVVKLFADEIKSLLHNK